jgi:hypothetical protein
VVCLCQLPNTVIIGEQEPYVVATMMPSRSTVACIEPVSGGTCPDWKLDNSMALPVAMTDTSLLLQVNAKNLVAEDTTIGSVEISLTEQDLKLGSSVWRPLDTGGELECTISVEDGKKRTGQVRQQ